MSQFADTKPLVAANPNQIGSSTGFKTGQKFPTPSPGNGDRVFYETLLVQRPDSEMAQEWCVNYGILPEKQAEQLYKVILKRKGKTMTTANAPSPAKTKPASSSSAAGGRAKKSKIIDEDVEIGTFYFYVLICN